MSSYFFCLNLDTEHKSNIETTKKCYLGADMRLLILIKWNQQEKEHTLDWPIKFVLMEVNMNYLEYLNKNIEGFGLIDKLRKNIKEIICKTIKEEFKGATESDVEKLSLMVECNFIDSITSSDTEWNIKEMTLEEVEIQIGGIVGFHHLCGGLDKNYYMMLLQMLFHVSRILTKHVSVQMR